MPIKSTALTHIDIYDRAVREHWAQQFSVTDERLRKAVRMVGSRITSVADYLNSAAR